MKVTSSFCDICQQPIKDKSYLFFMFRVTDRIQIQRSNMPRTMMVTDLEMEDLQEEMVKKCEELFTKEICPECKKVLDNFIQLRREEVQKIYNDITTAFEKEGETKHE